MNNKDNRIGKSVSSTLTAKEYLLKDSGVKKTIITDAQDIQYAEMIQYDENVFHVEFITGKFGRISAIIRTEDSNNKLKFLMTGNSYLCIPEKLEIKINEKGAVAEIVSDEYNLERIFSLKEPDDNRDDDFLTNTDYLEKIFINTDDIYYSNDLLITISRTSSPETALKAYEDYFLYQLYSKTGCKIDTTIRTKQKYNIFIPSAGKGTRIKDLTLASGNIAKPAITLPAKVSGHNYLLVYNTLDNLFESGVLGKTVNLKVLIENEPEGSASGLVRALKESRLSLHYPLIIRQCDAFSDINFSLFLKDYEASQPAVMIVCLPVGAERLNTLAVVAVNENKEVIEILEKPGTEEKASFGLIRGEGKKAGKYPGSIGMYILSPEALLWVREKILCDDSCFKDNEGCYDFANALLPELMKACQQGEIKDADGKEKKMLVHFSDSTWSDFGHTKDYFNQLKSIVMPESEGGKYYINKVIKEQFVKYIDIESGYITLPDAKHSFESFKKKYNPVCSGNILIFDD